MATQVEDLTVSQAISVYVKLRDKAAEKKAEYEASVAKLKVVMDEVEQHLLKHFNTTDTESARSTAGTAFKTTLSTVSVVDGEAFLDYIKANDAWQLLTRSAAKNAVEAFVEENGDLPPGVNLKQIVKVNVRRA